MKGCRPLKNEEVQIVMNLLDSKRDKAMFILGISTGFRISELLSLKVKDVYANGKPLNRASVSKANTKGKIESRSVIIGSHAKNAIADLVHEECLSSEMPLFLSRKGGAINRQQAWRVLKEAFLISGFEGKLASHTLRKTMAQNMWIASGKDIRKTQYALGHKSVNSTISYIAVDSKEVDDILINIDIFKIN